MENTIDIDLKYPIGPFIKKDEYSKDELTAMIEIIARAPKDYQNLVKSLSAQDFKKTYRPGSWNVQQLVHHVADIQLLHFFRMKKALTEPDYKEVTLINMDAWAATTDSLNAPVGDSLTMIEGITKRYVYLLSSLREEDFRIEYYHSVRKYSVNQAQAIGMSAWHLQHHLAHIKLAVSKG